MDTEKKQGETENQANEERDLRRVDAQEIGNLAGGEAQLADIEKPIRLPEI